VVTPLADIRRRVMGWRAAERREQVLRANQGPLDPAAALDAAFDLHQLFAPGSDSGDAIRDRELASARAAWRKLRERLACHPAAAIPH
jgi:hypothetical protein